MTVSTLARNLDALADCLRGGFGTPEAGEVVFEWTDSDAARERLGAPGRR